MTEKKIRIGISSCFSEPGASRLYSGRALVYVDRSLVQYLTKRARILLYIIPPIFYSSRDFEELVGMVDGLVLHGGDDISPETYGEKPIKEEWAGNRERDQYEIGLIKACYKLNKPILGICRGMQLINVTFGGTLYQDIPHFLNTEIKHKDDHEDHWHIHPVDLVKSSELERVYHGYHHETGVLSWHHQAVKDLGGSLSVEAVAADGIIEAIRLEQTHPSDPYCLGVQWHPECQNPDDSGMLNPNILLEHFLSEVEMRM